MKDVGKWSPVAPAAAFFLRKAAQSLACKCEGMRGGYLHAIKRREPIDARLGVEMKTNDGLGREATSLL
jgi:hypothetical protein